MIAAIAVLSFGSFTSYAQVKELKFELSSFNSIVVHGDFEVTVSHGDSYQAIITIEETMNEALTCEVFGQVLTIKMSDKNISNDIKNLFKGKNDVTPLFKALITMPEELSSISLEGKSSLSSTKDFNVESFKANISDNATLNAITVNSQHAVICTDKKGNASINIAADDLSVNTNGNSTLNISMTCKSVKADAFAFSNLTIHGDVEKLEFNGKGTSKVVIDGTMPSVSYNLNGGCNVNAHDVVCDDAVVKMNSICTLSEAASRSLDVELAGGATLLFDNAPTITIQDIKNSNMRKYSSTVKK